MMACYLSVSTRALQESPYCGALQKINLKLQLGPAQIVPGGLAETKVTPWPNTGHC